MRAPRRRPRRDADRHCSDISVARIWRHYASCQETLEALRCHDRDRFAADPNLKEFTRLAHPAECVPGLQPWWPGMLVRVQQVVPGIRIKSFGEAAE